MSELQSHEKGNWRPYGRSHSKHLIVPRKLAESFDHTKSCGWHVCNDQYYVSRGGPGEPKDLLDQNLLLFTVKGKGIALTDGTEYEMIRDTVMVFSKGISHTYYVPENGSWEFYWLHVSGPGADALIQYIIRENGRLFTISSQYEIANYIDLMVKTSYRYYDYELFAAQMISKILFCIMEDRHLKANETNNSKQIVIKTVEYIRHHYSETVQINSLSESLYCSPEHLIREFKSEVGMTPYQYLKQYRMRIAARCLEDDEMDMRSIAEKVGYRYESSFITAFKSAYHMTPQAYRSSIAHKMAQSSRDNNV